MTTFKRVRRGLLYETVAAQLREAILSREYLPGDRLPTENELTQEFKVSRAVIRQATMSLEHEGLVEVQVGAEGGAYVLESGVDAVLRAFENLFRHRGFAAQHYLEAKAVLEPALCAAIVAAATNADERRLENNLSNFEIALAQKAAEPVLLRLSLEFHELLVEASGNPYLQTVFTTIIRLGERVPTLAMVEQPDWAAVLTEHRQLLAALKIRCADTLADLMSTHLKGIEPVYQGVP